MQDRPVVLTPIGRLSESMTIGEHAAEHQRRGDERDTGRPDATDAPTGMPTEKFGAGSWISG